MRTGRLITITAVSAVVLGGVAAGTAYTLTRPSEPVSSPTGQSAPSATAQSPKPSTAPTGPATGQPVASTNARDTALATARMFCRPTVSATAWLADLQPLLSSDALSSYSATLPANVPCSGVTAAGEAVGDQQTSTDAAWQFPAATGGPVTVTLHRDNPTSTWSATYINPAG